MSRDQGCWTAQRQVGPGERTWAVWHIRNLDIKGSLKKKDANVVDEDEDEVAQFGCSPQSVGRSRRSIESGSATYWKRWKWISLPTRLEKNAELNWNEMKRESGRERVEERERERFERREIEPELFVLFLVLATNQTGYNSRRSTMLVLGGPLHV